MQMLYSLISYLVYTKACVFPKKEGKAGLCGKSIRKQSRELSFTTDKTKSMHIDKQTNKQTNKQKQTKKKEEEKNKQTKKRENKQTNKQKSNKMKNSYLAA